MKCRIMALAVALAGLIATSATANDELIAQQIIQRMQQHKQQAQLQDFNIGVQVEQGTVTVMGTVAQADHAVLALDVARRVPGVKLVVNDLFVQPQGQTAMTSVKSEAVNAPSAGNFAGFVADPSSDEFAQGQMPQLQYQQAQRQQMQMGQQQLQRQSLPQPQVQQAQLQVASPAISGPTSAPAVNQTPVPFARATSGVARPVSYQAPEYGQASPAQYASGSPAPVPMSDVSGGSLGNATYDNPQMPGYAWPSYASYPNYAAASYPQQYSPTAWPYIGPFYPYPQVPLGWRKVTLEWDDGWWFLDFKSK